jgi:hypothetical protein
MTGRNYTFRTFTGPSANKEVGKRRSVEAKLDLANAYHALFEGRASDAQREMVLVDLSDFSNFYKVLPAGASHDERAFHEGQRSVFGRIMSHLRMTPDERAALERAARHEAFVNQTEGEF